MECFRLNWSMVAILGLVALFVIVSARSDRAYTTVQELEKENRQSLVDNCAKENQSRWVTIKAMEKVAESAERRAESWTRFSENGAQKIRMSSLRPELERLLYEQIATNTLEARAFREFVVLVADAQDDASLQPNSPNYAVQSQNDCYAVP
jgi:hypothetical protein